MQATTQTNPHEVADTILAQLGGNRFAFMTGARYFMAAPKSLSFKVARYACAVELDGSDTYTVRKVSVRTGREVAREASVYVDQLRAVFERMFSLRVSL